MGADDNLLGYWLEEQATRTIIKPAATAVQS